METFKASAQDGFAGRAPGAREFLKFNGSPRLFRWAGATCPVPTTVQHLALNCRDRLAQEAFYSRHFGFRRARVFLPGQAGEFVMLRLGSMCVELFGSSGQPAPDQGGGEQAVGFKHLAFEVADLDATLAGLRADGVVPDRIIDAGEHVPGMRICFFRDPEGNILELMQGWQDEAV